MDENLPPAMARSLAALFVGSHEAVHLRDRFGPRVLDTEWIPVMSRDGHWVILSGDRHIAKKKSEQQAFRNSRLTGFFFAPGLQKAPLTKKMERLMAVWDTIERQVPLVSGGAMFEIQVRGNRLQQI